MVAAFQARARMSSEQLLARCGYFPEKTLKALEKKPVDSYIAAGKQERRKTSDTCKLGPLPLGGTRADKIAHNLQS
jgi:hypothetical protein